MDIFQFIEQIYDETIDLHKILITGPTHGDGTYAQLFLC